MAKLVRIEKAGGGMALGRVGGKLITDTDGAPCCCNPGDWREAVSCNDVNNKIYVPAASTCTGDGTSVGGKVVVYGPGCWGVSSATIADKDLPPDAVTVTDTEYDCVLGCFDPACGGTHQCCYHVFNGVYCTTVNGVDYIDANLVSVGSTPVYGVQYDADILIDLQNFGQFIGDRLFLRVTGSLLARYKKTDPISTVCQTDDLIESLSTMTAQIIDTTGSRNISDSVTFRVIQDIEDFGIFSRQTFAGGIPPSELAEPGKVFNASLGINWRGNVGGSTIVNQSGLYPIVSPCNAKDLNLAPLFADPGGGLSSSQVSTGFFEVTYRPTPLSPFTIIGSTFNVGRNNSFVPTYPATGSTTYTRSALSASAQTIIDSQTASPIAGGGTETHTVQINVTERAWVEFGGPCNPNANSPVPPLPEGINPETMQPYTQPGKCYGCGQ